MEQAAKRPFFVYGTLLPDQPNFHLWESAVTAMEPATFLGGRLHDMGFYPMLITAAAAEKVQGMVITVDPAHYTAVLQRLDELEGYNPEQPDSSAYQRKPVEVQLANGRTQIAWIYLGQPQFVRGTPLVAGGDWAAYAAQNQPAMQAWWDAITSVSDLHQKILHKK